MTESDETRGLPLRREYAGRADVGQFGPHVVEQQVGVEAEPLAVECGNVAGRRGERGRVARVAAHELEDLLALLDVGPGSRVFGQNRLRRGQKTHVVDEEIQLLCADFGIGHHIEALRQGDSVVGFFHRVRRGRNPHLKADRLLDEATQGGVLGPAAEAARPSGRIQVRPARDAVTVYVVRVGVANDVGLRD